MRNDGKPELTKERRKGMTIGRAAKPGSAGGAGGSGEDGNSHGPGEAGQAAGQAVPRGSPESSPEQPGPTLQNTRPRPPSIQSSAGGHWRCSGSVGFPLAMPKAGRSALRLLPVPGTLRIALFPQRLRSVSLLCLTGSVLLPVG